MQHVLVVDDRSNACELIDLALKGTGAFRISHARAGDEALDLLDHVRPDIVIVDAVLSGFSSIDIAARAVQQDIAILLMTDEPELAAQLEHAGWPHLRKPFGFGDLIRQIRRSMEIAMLYRRRVRESVRRVRGSLQEMRATSEQLAHTSKQAHNVVDLARAQRRGSDGAYPRPDRAGGTGEHPPHGRLAPYRNRLLAALAPEDRDRLWPELALVPLPPRQILVRPGETVPDIYFPESGVISLLTPVEGGDSLEVGLIGREGVIGLAALGSRTASHRALVQIPGMALRIGADTLRRAAEQSAPLRALLLRHGEGLLVQVSQTAACSGRHSVDQRLARWLLSAHDRVDGDRLPLTQASLSQILGVRRAGVTVAAGALHRAGIIDGERGCITIRDRGRLEAASCICYRIVRSKIDRLLG